MVVEQRERIPSAQSEPLLWRGSVALVAKPGGPNTGVGRYVHTLHRGLQEGGVDAIRIAPSVPPLPDALYAALCRLGADARTFLNNYPVWAGYPPADVYHITSQNLATTLLFRRPPGRVVVTVHDIIPYMLRDDPEMSSYRTAADRLFDRLAMLGLKRADLLIADSQYTKRCLIEHLGIAAGRIKVIYLGVDYDRFRPMPVPASIRERFGLPEGQRYLIYVGSEDPRKNLPALVRALAEVRRDRPEVHLIKVGRAHFVGERQRLISLAGDLGVLPAIHFLDDVAEEDLPMLYNLADLCVMPSLYEGFGFPVVEAMACGTPVVCNDASSLSELGGGAAFGYAGRDRDAGVLAAAVLGALAAGVDSSEVRERCIRRAGEFRWSTTVRQTVQAYDRLCRPPGC